MNPTDVFSDETDSDFDTSGIENTASASELHAVSGNNLPVGGKLEPYIEILVLCVFSAASGPRLQSSPEISLTRRWENVFRWSIPSWEDGCDQKTGCECPHRERQ